MNFNRTWYGQQWPEAHLVNNFPCCHVGGNSSPMCHRFWCVKMEVVLCNTWYCMEGSLQGGVWSWHSRGFMLSRTGEVLVRFSLVLSGMPFLHWYLINLSNFVLQLARSVLEDDDICVVAKLLGDIMAYRASGTGHLELLAGWFSIYLLTQSTFLYDLSIFVSTCMFICALTLWFHDTYV